MNANLFITHHDLLKQLQNNDIMMYWMIDLLMSGKNIFTTLPLLYFQVSSFTCCMAYAVDFTNEFAKLNGVIPLWLILYNYGCLFIHFTKVLFLTPTSQLQVILFAFASQYTNKIWTKNSSMSLYWLSVLIWILVGYHHRCELRVNYPISPW